MPPPLHPNLTEERRQELVLSCIPLAYRLASRWWKRGPEKGVDELKELQAEALYALVKGSYGFDPKRGVQFVSFVWKCIIHRFEILTKPVHPQVLLDHLSATV